MRPPPTCPANSVAKPSAAGAATCMCTGHLFCLMQSHYNCIHRNPTIMAAYKHVIRTFHKPLQAHIIMLAGPGAPQRALYLHALLCTLVVGPCCRLQVISKNTVSWSSYVPWLPRCHHNMRHIGSTGIDRNSVSNGVLEEPL